MSLIRLSLCIPLFLSIVPSAVAESVRSPNGSLQLVFTLLDGGRPSYSLRREGAFVLEEGILGLQLREGAGLADSFSVARVETTTIDETWETVWGEQRWIRNNCNELTVELMRSGDKKQRVLLRFRVFNDGIGFRYEFPQQPGLDYFTVTDELTEFNLAADHTTFWMPGDYDTNEYQYTTSRLSAIDARSGKTASEIYARSAIGPEAVQTPLMMKTEGGLYVNIHEAALVDYPAMNLVVDRTTFNLRAHLVPDASGNKAYMQTPCHTPWRTVIVSDKPEDILSSKLILNLNAPSKIGATDWIRPIKYVGIWWELHVGKSTWNYADAGNVKLDETDWKTLTPNGRHGATTKRTKRYIDFAAEHGFGGVLVEGWNVGWEDWFGKWKEEVFDFVTPYPDFDVVALQEYASSKNVKLIMHHETSASVTNYERRMDEAFRFMKDHGYDAVKTGYVGKIIPRGEYHDGQWMVNHYVRVAEKAASYKIMVDAR